VVSLGLDLFIRGGREARREIGGLGDEADRTSDRFDKMKGAMAAGAAAAGATAGGLLAAGFAGNLDLEAGRAKLGAQLGLTATKSEQVGKSAGKLYAANYGASMEEVNDAIGSVIQNIDGMRDASADTLENITKKVLNLSTTTGETSSAISASISQMLRTGLAKNADEAMDILTVGFQQGVNKSEDLLDTFTEYGTQFRKMGMDGKQATGLLSQGLKAGARDADTVADTIKEFSILAVEKGGTAGKAFKSLGLDAKQMASDIAAGGPRANKALDTTLDRLRAVKDPVDRAALAVQLFGTKAEDMGDALFALDPSTAVKGLGDVAGAADKMDKTLGETGQARIESMKRGFEQWTQEMAGTEGALGQVSGAVVGFGGPALAMGGQIGMMVSGLAAMNVGLVLSKAGTVVATVATTGWTVATKVAVVAARGFAVGLRLVGIAMTFATGPVGLIVIAIAAAAAGLIYAYKHSEKFRTIVQTSMKLAGDAVRFMWDRVMKPTFRFLVKGWMDVVGGILNGAAKAFGWVPGVGPKLRKASEEFNKFKDRTNRALDGIKDERVDVTARFHNSLPRTLYGVRIGGGVGSTRGGITATMATGGPVRGGRGGIDDVPALLTRDEHVWTKQEVNAIGGHGEMMRMRKAAVTGRYATGGAVGVRDGLNRALPRGASEIGLTAAKQITRALISVSGIGLNGALQFARAQVGKPYIWGGVGPNGYDCSGFMSALLNVVQKRNPYQRRFATGNFPTAGWVPGPGNFMIGSFRGNPGHMAGTINGVNVESAGSTGPRVGRSARGARDRMFRGLWHLKGYAKGGPVTGDAPYDLLDPFGEAYLGDDIREAFLADSGGMVRSGAAGINRSGVDERMLSPRQTRSFERLVRVLDRRSMTGPTPPSAPGLSAREISETMVRALSRGDLRVVMDGQTVGRLQGRHADLLGRAN
jgi:phage-related minor tail protein